MAVDHCCVTYRGDDQLSAAALTFLTRDVTGSHQVAYVGWGTHDELVSRLPALTSPDVLGAGAVRVVSFDEHFAPDAAPDGLVEFWADVTEAALDAGFSAVRAVADTTPWLGEPERRARTLRAEHELDRYHLDHPLSVLCVCDASRLDADALAEITCIHAEAEGTSTSPFHLSAASDADFAMSGEIDAFSVGLLDRVLTVLERRRREPELVINAEGLSYLDHRTLIGLQDHAERRHLTAVVLRAAPPVATRVAGMLSLRRVRVEQAS